MGIFLYPGPENNTLQIKEAFAMSAEINNREYRQAILREIL